MRAVFRTMLKLKNELGLKVTTALSRAGLEVARLYGVLDGLGAISPGATTRRSSWTTPSGP